MEDNGNVLYEQSTLEKNSTEGLKVARQQINMLYVEELITNEAHNYLSKICDEMLECGNSNRSEFEAAVERSINDATYDQSDMLEPSEFKYGKHGNPIELYFDDQYSQRTIKLRGRGFKENRLPLRF